MSEEKQRYHSFLLRLWQVKENEHTAWRASLESSHTGERWGFAGLDAAYAFLRRRISEAPGSGGEADAGTRDGRR
ncbi:MAG: hypothetical protein ACK2UI_04095 [Anaerolineae bacterium]|jgi:hypothetical protein